MDGAGAYYLIFFRHLIADRLALGSFFGLMLTLVIDRWGNIHVFSDALAGLAQLGFWGFLFAFLYSFCLTPPRIWNEQQKALHRIEDEGIFEGLSGLRRKILRLEPTFYARFRALVSGRRDELIDAEFAYDRNVQECKRLIETHSNDDELVQAVKATLANLADLEVGAQASLFGHKLFVTDAKSSVSKQISKVVGIIDTRL